MRFTLESGRRVAVHLTGTRALWPAAETGRNGRRERLVVFCHSAPGAGSFDPDPAQTQARKVTLLSVDRPGYGHSDRVSAGQWATVASAADDIAAVLDTLPVDRVGVAGWSAGGRVALALAARRPDVVDRVVVVATPAPDDELPWVDPGERRELERLRGRAPEHVHGALASRLGPLVPADPHSREALWLLAAVTSDEPALRRPGARTRLGQLLRAAFAQGAAGLAADIAGYCLRPWGFDPEAVQAKTLLLYGSRDPVAGPDHGYWWQERLPDARLEVAAGAGHLVLIPTWPRALSHLVGDRERLRVVAGFGERATETGIEEFSAA